jgi:TRAP-type C4-dicarboxylate transport system permease small subunit
VISLKNGGRWFRTVTDRILSAVIFVLLGGMVALAAAQIVMRNVFSYSLFWGDELLQLALLWLVMAGAVAAARHGEHIRINVLERYFPDRTRPWLGAVLHGCTATICGVLTLHSTRFVMTSAHYGDTLLGNVPAWLGQLVIPVGFGLLALQYAGRMLQEVFHGARRQVPVEDG